MSLIYIAGRWGKRWAQPGNPPFCNSASEDSFHPLFLTSVTSYASSPSSVNWVTIYFLCSRSGSKITGGGQAVKKNEVGWKASTRALNSKSIPTTPRLRYICTNDLAPSPLCLSFSTGKMGWGGVGDVNSTCLIPGVSQN